MRLARHIRVRYPAWMWIKATEHDGQVIWLNMALARSMVRVVDAGADAKTVIAFDEADQITVRELPEDLIAKANADPSSD